MSRSDFAESDRAAFITIQGGGLFGLSLLGQLSAVTAAEIAPLALSGNSAGAVIATLYWSGLKPNKIREHFEKRANTLQHLLGPFDPSTPFEAFDRLRRRFEGFIASEDDALRRKRGFFNRVNFLRPLAAGGQALRTMSEIRNHIAQRGMFPGDDFEREIESLIRQGFKAQNPNIELPEADPVTFDWVNRKIRDRHLYCPPLFLTATNLTTRRLEVISSIEPRHANVPVAKAVRASAGFPVIFRPVDLPLPPNKSWFVDGGMITNFPAWVFARHHRTLAESTADDVARQFFARPMMHIGLRVVDDEPKQLRDLTQPREFVRSLIALATGNARNELDKVLSSFVSRSCEIEQRVSETRGPQDLFAFSQIDEDKVTAMYTAGKEIAERTINRLSFRLPHGEQERLINQYMRSAIDKACLLFGAADNAALGFRVNVFVPIRQRLVLRYQVNMDGDPDENMEFSIQAGLVGLCYVKRVPHLCNLQDIAAMDQRELRESFEMTADDQARIKADRTFLVSVPIFDPQEMRPIDGRLGLNTSSRAFATVDAPIDGPVMGVLGLDAGLSYTGFKLNPDPAKQAVDPRIQGLLDVLQQTSMAIARVLSVAYGGQTR